MCRECGDGSAVGDRKSREDGMVGVDVARKEGRGKDSGEVRCVCMKEIVQIAESTGR